MNHHPKEAFEPDKINQVENGPGGLLANIARSIWDARNITYEDYKELLKRAFQNTHKTVLDPVERNKKQNTDRGNHWRKISYQRMTWPVFISTLQVIRVKRMKIRFEFVFHDGDTTEIVREVVISREE